MKSISETDGLDRKRRLAEASRTIPLRVLEDEFPVLLSRALRLAREAKICLPGRESSVDFAALYQYQPLVILSIIEDLNVRSLEETFERISDEAAKSSFIASLQSRLDEGRERLEYAYMTIPPSLFLQDLRVQLDVLKRSDAARDNLSPVLAIVRKLQEKIDVYREEITSSGQMDPSLALLAAFLSNYAGIAARFNRRWQELPAWYIFHILGEKHRPEVPETAWLTYTGDENVLTGYKLLTSLQPTSIKLKQIDLLLVERRKECHPESALGYVTSLKQGNLPVTEYLPTPVGLILRSSVFLLSGGKRDVVVACTLTPESLVCFEELVAELAKYDSMKGDEVLYKVLDGSFALSITTAQGWRKVACFTLRFYKENRQLQFRFLLDNDFPPVCGETENSTPGVRILLQPSTWLYPYSWGKQMRLESIAVDVQVEGLHDGVFYNELGPMDAYQSFAPFGGQNERGSWIAFGHYEMACKRVTQVRLNFNWQQIPRHAGGLYAYYKGYRRPIDNRSFTVRTEYLQNGQWKPTPEESVNYLFRTVDSEDIPRADGVLSEQSSVGFTTPALAPLAGWSPEAFRPGISTSGFYRLVFDTPEMGFGEKEYRRLFFDVMQHNAHHRRKIALPEEPLSPRWDAPVLNYTAHEERTFSMGGSSALYLEYITPLSIREVPDFTVPVPLLQGPDDETVYQFTFSDAEGVGRLFMYIEMEPLRQEIDHDSLPQTSWFYDDGIRRQKIPSSKILRDETGGWMHSGVMEIQLPNPVSREMLDEDGCFHMYLFIHCHSGNCASLRNLHFNMVQAEAVSHASAPDEYSPLTGYRFVSSVNEKVAPESDVELQLRVSERVTHRNRPLLARDYERIILQEFPEIRKVKCLLGVDAKNRKRQALVTLAVIGNTPDKQLGCPPLCEDRLLCSVEKYLQACTSPFVEIDAINPVYETVTVFCGISPADGQSTGGVIAALQQLINSIIAPWYEEGETPLFGHSFSMQEMQEVISKHPSVSALHGIKIAHLVSRADGGYVLHEYRSEPGGNSIVQPSSPWGILVPAVRTYVIFCTAEQWGGELEFGDLEIEQTFVIT